MRSLVTIITALAIACAPLSASALDHETKASQVAASVQNTINDGLALSSDLKTDQEQQTVPVTELAWIPKKPPRTRGAQLTWIPKKPPRNIDALLAWIPKKPPRLV